jgi:hypothetical protein
MGTSRCVKTWCAQLADAWRRAHAERALVRLDSRQITAEFVARQSP